MTEIADVVSMGQGVLLHYCIIIRSWKGRPEEHLPTVMQQESEDQVTPHSQTRTPGHSSNVTTAAGHSTRSGMAILLAGTVPPRLHQTNRFTVLNPILLPRVRCYTDASITPDQPPQQLRLAGLGVFFVNTQVQPAQTIYIRRWR